MSFSPEEIQAAFARADQKLSEAQRELRAIGFDAPPFFQGARDGVLSQTQDARDAARRIVVKLQRTGD